MFLQIKFSLDATKYLIVDLPPVSQVDHRIPLGCKGLSLQTLIRERLIRTWLDWKRENEVDFVRLRPHPAEFSLYFDA